MNDLEQPSRWSQAQALIAALFAVVLTGEMPDDTPDDTPDPDRFTPLAKEYPHLLLTTRRKIKPLLARACVHHLGASSYDLQRRIDVVNLVCRLPLLPSVVASRVGVPHPGNGSGKRFLDFHDRARDVAASLGINHGDVTACCRWPKELDSACELVRAKLKVMDLEAPPSERMESLRNQYAKYPNFSEIAREQKVSPSHVRRVFFGISTSERISRAIEQKVAGRGVSL